MSTINSRLAAAIEDATTALRAAETVNIHDDLAILGSHTHLIGALSRLLWNLDETEDTQDRAARIPAQVAAEDGVRWIGVPYQRGPVAA